MKLRFLGVEYTYSPKSVDVTEGDVMGKYRGVPWRAKRYNAPAIEREDVTLHFLGGSYHSHL
ncbi:MAG: DUF4278 domain-containing protein [Leptolyngbyaceae cyanobacterium MO_188.B28]|nr:DUF4278 domain-containing protein [Leptolyngbyaceae cyanobacterium MO_188.B28]